MKAIRLELVGIRVIELSTFKPTNGSRNIGLRDHAGQSAIALPTPV